MKLFLVAILAFVSCCYGFCQTLHQPHIEGYVRSAPDSAAMPGVTIVVKGTTKGTVTDANGYFELDLAGVMLPASDAGKIRLIFSATAYSEYEILINAESEYVEVTFGGKDGGSFQQSIIEKALNQKIYDPGYAKTKVYFATDRAATTSTGPITKFGSKRSSTISYGQIEVSIPRDHRMGEIEKPKWWKFEFSEDPNSHMVILSTTTKTKTTFFADLNKEITASSGKNALIFFHGYNVTFEDAALTTAQMAYDVGFDGAPVFYSWPSNGALLEYTVDETNIEWSQSHIKAFLADFVTKSGSNNIYLIAHSMGNRGMTKALVALFTEHPEYRTRFKEIILAAPDIDADTFKDDIAPVLANAERPVTLYASSKDKALMASKKLHEYPRAGQSEPGRIVVVKGMETIDASNVKSDFLGHSYVMGEASIISDIFYMVQGLRASKRHGLSPQGQYFIFRK